MKHEFNIGQKVWRNTVVNGRAEIEVGIIASKRTITTEVLSNGGVEQYCPEVYYRVSVNDVVLDKAIEPYEWFTSKEELIKHLFAGKS